ncbi:MAG: hypothetical protein LH606_08500 [Cytophagaceae bacterium]|nr:hypothetical protein [Cytophagaceae bacterium]
MKNKTKSSDSENPAQIEVPKIVQIEDYLFGAHNYRLNLVANDLERSAKGQNTFVAVADEQLAYELFRAGFKGFGQHWRP